MYLSAPLVGGDDVVVLTLAHDHNQCSRRNKKHKKMKAVALAVVLLLALSCTRGVTALLLREHPLPISLLSENLRFKSTHASGWWWWGGERYRGDAAEGTTVVDLGGDTWRVASSNGSITAPATVPGVVHLDLLVKSALPSLLLGRC
jgi:hypothetical protein